MIWFVLGLLGWLARARQVAGLRHNPKLCRLFRKSFSGLEPRRTSGRNQRAYPSCYWDSSRIGIGRSHERQVCADRPAWRIEGD